MFIRASDPSPSTSCAWSMHSRGFAASASSISPHHGSRPRTPVARTSSTDSGGSDSYQPRSVSLSWVPV
jgi:hypothetical protein